MLTAELNVVIDAIPMQEMIAEELLIELLKIPVGADVFKVQANRVAWPEIDHAITLRVDLSLDGGLTWARDANRAKPWPWGGFPFRIEARGGETLDDKGMVDPLTALQEMIPEPKNPNRVIKIILTTKTDLATKIEFACAVFADLIGIK